MPKYKLVCFDVDGTLVDNVVYSWELFHNYFDVDMNKREEMKNKYYKLLFNTKLFSILI